jgi:hypothetical protein
MRRKLAVPLAIGNLGHSGHNVMKKTRKLRVSGPDSESQRLLSKLAENRDRIENLEFLRANIELGLVEIAGELEEIQSSEEILSQAMA